MYNWTRMSARVIVTPGDVTPASFSHPLLASVKVAPQPVTMKETKTDVAAVQMPEKPASVAASTAPKAESDATLELRSTLGHTDLNAAAEENHSSASPKVKTADASGALPVALSSDNTSDAASASEQRPQPEASASDQTASDNENFSARAAQTDAPKPETNPKAAKQDEAATEAKPASNVAVDTQPAKSADSEAKPATSLPLKEDVKSDDAKLVPPLKKTEQIAVFVSRKDSKLYVRQNLAPLFDVPVTIAADERPLGTHIFTAQVDRNDPNALHWSVVSLPMPAKAASRRNEEPRTTHGRRIANAGAIEAKLAPTPDSPAEALDRLSLPVAVMAKIYEAVSTGGSIIVSDQSIAAGETGEGTDFIVPLR
jgi:hypothetical protein